MKSLTIVILCVCAAVVYGIVHDQFTARLCVEYFTKGHPPVFPTEDPTLLGLGWGILATWWMGLLLGVPLAIAAQAGRRTPRSAGSLFKPLAILLGVTGLCALSAGLTGWQLAEAGVVYLVGPIASELPANRHAVFLADLWAHSASYLAGFAGGVILIIHVWRTRPAAVPR